MNQTNLTLLSKIDHNHLNKLLLEIAETGICVLDINGKIQLANPAAREMFGYTENELIGKPLQQLINHDSSDSRNEGSDIELTLADGEIRHVDTQFMQHKDGGNFPVEYTVNPVHQDSLIAGALVSFRDITQDLYKKKLDAVQQKILNVVASDIAFEKVLSRITELAVEFNPNMCCSILLLDKDGCTLRHGAAAGLPKFFNQAVDGVKIGEGVGSCGNTTFTGKRTIVENIMTHPYWQEYKELAQRAGVQACWSEPIHSAAGEVLGSFAIYYKTTRKPSEDEITFIEHTAKIISAVLERSRAERELRENETRFSLSQAYSNVGTFEWDAKSDTTIYSDEVWKLLGLERNSVEASFEFYMSLIHEDDREKFTAVMQDCFVNKTDVDVEYRIRWPDGSVHWIRGRGSAEFDEQGKPLKMLGVLIGIDKLKQTQIEAEQKLAADARAKDFIARGVLLASETTSLEHGFQSCIELVCEYLQWPVGHVYIRSEEQNAMVSFDIWQLDSAEKHQDFVRVSEQNMFPKGKGFPGRIWASHELETIYDIQTDENFPRAKMCQELHLHGAIGFPIVINGEVQGVLEFFNYKCFARDADLEKTMMIFAGQVGRIFERYLEHEEKVKLQMQLQQAQKMESIGQLTGGIAHDFNNMLASIIGFTELAQRLKIHDDSGRLASYLEQVRIASKKAADLVSQMLAFSRTDSSKDKREKLLVNTILEETVSMLRPILPSSIELNVDASSASPVINANAVMINQVLMNLCVNAKDAMEEAQGQIAIDVRYVDINNGCCTSCHNCISGKYVEIAVKDTGSGMSSKVLGHLFEPFYTTKEVGKGSGMGLPMVHGIMHKHEGHIVVESTSGAGSTFRLLFPAVEAGQQKAKELAGDGAGDSAGVKEKQILVVDDEVSITMFLQEFLESNGYAVITRNSSQEALSYYEQNSGNIGLVITDYTMPEMTGMQMAQAMMALNSNLPVILCTGFSEHINAVKAKQLNVREYLEKPLDTRKLLKAIGGYI